MLYNIEESYLCRQREAGAGRDGCLVFLSAHLDNRPELKDHSPESFQWPLIRTHCRPGGLYWVTVMNSLQRLRPAMKLDYQSQA